MNLRKPGGRQGMYYAHILHVTINWKDENETRIQTLEHPNWWPFYQLDIDISFWYLV